MLLPRVAGRHSRHAASCGQVRPSHCGVALVLVVQHRPLMQAEEALPSQADRDDGRAQLPADAGVGVGDGLLRLWRVQPRPGHVEDRRAARCFDRLVEEADVLVHPLGVFDRQRALLLEYDPVVIPLFDRLSCLASVPMGSERRAAGADQVVLKALAARGRQLRD